ncbi:MAG: hypothetical protein IJH64_08215 [Oscillospiraceae bacterium]|nr:hypothetical protein [Oscillospiraceae bacterium]
MKKAGISIFYNDEKLSAVKMYMKQKDLDIKSELERTIDGMYAKYVPSNVREFIDMKAVQKSSRTKVSSVNSEETDEE